MNSEAIVGCGGCDCGNGTIFFGASFNRIPTRCENIDSFYFMSSSAEIIANIPIIPSYFRSEIAVHASSNVILNQKFSPITKWAIPDMLEGENPILMMGLWGQIMGSLSALDPFSKGANYNFGGDCLYEMDGNRSECGAPPGEGEGSFAELSDILELRDTDVIMDLVSIDTLNKNKKSLIRAGWAIVLCNLDLLAWAHCVVYGRNKSRFNCVVGRFLSYTSYPLAGPGYQNYPDGNLYIDSVSSEDEYVYSYQVIDGEKYYPGFASWPGYLNALGYPGGGCATESEKSGMGIGAMIGGFVGAILGGPFGAFAGAAIGGFVGAVAGDAVDACTLGERPAPWGYMKVADYGDQYFPRYMYSTWQWGEYADQIAAAMDVAITLVHEFQHVCGAYEDKALTCSNADLVENIFAWALLNKYRTMWVSKCFRGAYWDENYQWIEKDHAPDRSFVADIDSEFGLRSSFDKSYGVTPCQKNQLI